MPYLVGLSGGPRSARALADYLAAGRRVVAHHVRTGDATATNRARRTVGRLQLSYAFEYHESEMRHATESALPAVARALSPLAHVAGRPRDDIVALVLGSDGGHRELIGRFWRALRAEPALVLFHTKAAPAPAPVVTAPEGEGKVLVLWSGGADSTGMLCRLLRTGHDIHAHHVSLRPHFSRLWEPELQACRRIVERLRADGFRLGYTESVLDLRQSGQTITDIAAVSAEAAHLTWTPGMPKFKCMARGSAHHDIYSEITPAVLGRREIAERIWAALRAYDIPMWYPVERFTGAELWASMPPDIAALTISCRKPEPAAARWRACRTCEPCTRMLAQGVPLSRALAA